MERPEDEPKQTPRRRSPVLAFVGLLLRFVVVVAILYGVGFALFVSAVPPATANAPADQADGIVALTGGGGRLGPAVALLEQGAAQRLLITGVNPTTTKAQLGELLGGGARFDCCVDLGFEATDTRGNAREAAMWVKTRGYTSVIVVTTTYHMPRSLMEFSAQMPDVAMVPYPVSPTETNLPTRQTLQRLNDEYAKYLASAIRNLFGGTPAGTS